MQAERDVATAASSALLRLQGAAVFRVHNVAINRDALAVADAMLAARRDFEQERRLMGTKYTITLQNCAFFARHGVHDEEEFLGQRFFVDAELDVVAAGALESDCDRRYRELRDCLHRDRGDRHRQAPQSDRSAGARISPRASAKSFIRSGAARDRGAQAECASARRPRFRTGER